jgi:hypothetical protein
VRASLRKNEWIKTANTMLKRLQEKDSEFSKGMFEISVKGIVDRTQRGVDIAGMAFKPYSEKYAVWKRGKGYSTTPNLVLSGKMISQYGFEYEVLGGGGKFYIRIFIPNKHHSGYGKSTVDHYTLASVHNFGMLSGRKPHFKMPKREFMGFGEKIISELQAYSEEHWRKIFQGFK